MGLRNPLIEAARLALVRAALLLGARGTPARRCRAGSLRLASGLDPVRGG